MPNVVCWCGSMAEHLTRNEKVVSSILTTSSRQKKPLLIGAVVFTLCLNFKFDLDAVHVELCPAAFAAGLNIAAARASLERYELGAYELNGT